MGGPLRFVIKEQFIFKSAAHQRLHIVNFLAVGIFESIRVRECCQIRRTDVLQLDKKCAAEEPYFFTIQIFFKSEHEFVFLFRKNMKDIEVF